MRYTPLICASPLAMAALLCAPVAAEAGRYKTLVEETGMKLEH